MDKNKIQFLKEMEMRNVHEFDGKIHIEGLIELDGDEEKKKLLTAFSERMLDDFTRKMWETIVDRRDQQNYDPINASDAFQILLALLKKISLLAKKEDQEEWYIMLEEQLGDMVRLGPCPQGRTIRLWQLYTSIG